MPEHHARRFFLGVEQAQLLADAPVVAALGLLDAVQVGFQRLGIGPGGAVDALQHLVARIAAPVGACQLGQLEGLQLAGAGHVRPAAEIDEIALTVQREVLALRDARDDLGLVLLAHAAEERHRLVARHHAALDRDVGGGQFFHLLLDRGQVLGREGTLEGEIVIEAVLDHRADRDLRRGEQRLHGLREQVRGGMADDLERIVRLVGDDGERCVVRDGVRGVDQFAVDARAECGLGQAGADAGGNFADGDGRVELTLAAIGQGDSDGHTGNPWRW